MCKRIGGVDGLIEARDVNFMLACNIFLAVPTALQFLDASPRLTADKKAERHMR